MELRKMRVGDYQGLAFWGMAGHWIVSVSQYVGFNPSEGHQWRLVPAENFFRLDVLRRQLQSAGIEVDASFQEHHCILVPQGRIGRIARQGALIKRFMAANYGTFGPEHRGVSWSWGVRQPD